MNLFTQPSGAYAKTFYETVKFRYKYLPLFSLLSERRCVLSDKTQKAPKGIKYPEKANIGTFKQSFRIIFSGRLFNNISYLYTTTIKTIKSRQKRPIKIINAGFVSEGQIIYRKIMPCETVGTFHRAVMQQAGKL